MQYNLSLTCSWIVYAIFTEIDYFSKQFYHKDGITNIMAKYNCLLEVDLLNDKFYNHPTDRLLFFIMFRQQHIYDFQNLLTYEVILISCLLVFSPET